MSDSRPVLAASGVTRTYRLPRASVFGGRAERHALRGVDLELGENATLGVVGESGSGKSTLVRILLGLHRATAGTVSYRGRDIRPGRPRQLRWFRREVQVVFQDPLSSLDPKMTVEQVVSEPLTCLGVEDDHRRRVAEVLESVGIDPSTKDRFPHEFSGGQQQRIAIARAIAPRPTVLVGDEPVSALDVSVRAQILDLLRELVAEYRLSLILVSHDLGVVQSLCDDVLVLNEGQVVERGPASDVFTRPSHPYTQRLVAAVPRLPV